MPQCPNCGVRTEAEACPSCGTTMGDVPRSLTGQDVSWDVYSAVGTALLTGAMWVALGAKLALAPAATGQEAAMGAVLAVGGLLHFGIAAGLKALRRWAFFLLAFLLALEAFVGWAYWVTQDGWGLLAALVSVGLFGSLVAKRRVYRI